MYSVPSSRRKKKKFRPVSLIPVLDVVFILVFFLLASSQLLRIFEIGSDLPIFMVSTDKQEKEKFSLKAVVTANEVKLLNSQNKSILGQFSPNWEDPKSFEDLNMKVKAIKEQYPEKYRVLVESKLDVKYQYLVAVLDNLRKDNFSEGERKEFFPQIMFED